MNFPGLINSQANLKNNKFAVDISCHPLTKNLSHTSNLLVNLNAVINRTLSFYLSNNDEYASLVIRIIRLIS